MKPQTKTITMRMAKASPEEIEQANQLANLLLAVCEPRNFESPRFPSGEEEFDPDNEEDLRRFYDEVRQLCGGLERVTLGYEILVENVCDPDLSYLDFKPSLKLLQGADENYGAGCIAKERLRQINEEGWTPEHDDEHTHGELASAGACYALKSVGFDPVTSIVVEHPETDDLWPWEEEWWKPSENPINNLIKSGALIAAEIDRLKREIDSWHVYQMNDCDWWLARSLEQAKKDYIEFTGFGEDEVADARELTSEELRSKTFWEGEDRDPSNPEHWQCECGHKADSNDRWNGIAYEHCHDYPLGHVVMENIHRRSFEAELARRVINHPTSSMFASTEY